MKNYNATLTEQDIHNIARYNTILSALSSGKIDKYEYDEILPSNQSGIIKQAKFTYSPLGRAFKKQIKTIEEQGEKQIKTLEDHRKQPVKSSDEKESLTDSKQKEIKFL